MKLFRKTTGAAEEFADQAVEKAKEVAGEADKVARSARNEGREVLQTLRTEITPLVEKVRDGASAFGQDVKQQASQALDSTNGYVRAHPWRAVGLMALAGMLIGSLMTGSRRSVAGR